MRRTDGCGNPSPRGHRDRVGSWKNLAGGGKKPSDLGVAPQLLTSELKGRRGPLCEAHSGLVHGRGQEGYPVVAKPASAERLSLLMRKESGELPPTPGRVAVRKHSVGGN